MFCVWVGGDWVMGTVRVCKRIICRYPYIFEDTHTTTIFNEPTSASPRHWRYSATTSPGSIPTDPPPPTPLAAPEAETVAAAEEAEEEEVRGTTPSSPRATTARRSCASVSSATTTYMDT